MYGLAACAPMSVSPNLPVVHQGSAPAVGKEATVTVGSPMLTAFNYRAYAGAIGHMAKGDIALVKTTLPDGRTAYCQQDMLGCVLDTDRDGRFDLFTQVNVPPMRQLIVQPKVDPPYPYEITDTAVVVSNDGYKYELLYQGVSNNVLRVTYREYLKDMIRPAFQQDLTYTASEKNPTDIKFRDVSITVLRANNNDITYRVNSGFNLK